MFRSIRAKMLFVSLSILVVALLANAALNYEVGRRANETVMVENLSAVENAHAFAIEEWISTRQRMVMALQDAALKPDPLPWLQQMVQAGGFALAAVGWADKRLTTTVVDPLPPGFDPTVRPWYMQAAAAREMIMTKPFIGVPSNKLLVSFAAPVVEDGVLKGVVNATVYMDAVAKNVMSIHPTPSSFGALVDGDGVVVAYPDSSFLGKQLRVAVPALGNVLAQAIDAVPQKLTLDGAKKLAMVQRIHGSDWRLIVVLDEAEASKSMHSQLISSAAALLFIAVIATVTLSLLIAALLKRLDSVRRAMTEIASGTGDLTLRLPVSGNDEIAEICVAFNGFVEMLLHVMRRVRDNSETVRSAATQIAAGNQDLSERTESAAASVGSISSSVERIVQMIEQTNTSMGKADERSRHTTNLASERGRGCCNRFSEYAGDRKRFNEH